jgi:hypothetical protein
MCPRTSGTRCHSDLWKRRKKQKGEVGKGVCCETIVHEVQGEGEAQEQIGEAEEGYGSTISLLNE